MHEHTHDDECCAEYGHAAPHVPERASAVLYELRNHIPFSVSAVVLGLIMAGTICIMGFADAPPAAIEGGPRMAKRTPSDAGDAAATHDPDHADHEEHAAADHEEHTPAGHPDDAHADDAHADDAHVHDAHVHDGGQHMHSPNILFFHLFHPAHMFFSAAATTAMFQRYDRRLLKAIIIGLIGAIGVCGVSDIVMPQVSLWMLRIITPWHICVWEHPGLVLPFAALGVLVGLWAAGGVIHSTFFSHSLHVFASTMASIFYMVGPMGMVDWVDRIGAVFFFVVIAVMIPCCVSDIVFPVLMTSPGRRSFEEHGHHH